MKKWLFMLAALVVFAAPAQAALYEGLWLSGGGIFNIGQMAVTGTALDGFGTPEGQWQLGSPGGTGSVPGIDFTYTSETDPLLPDSPLYTSYFESTAGYGPNLGDYDTWKTYEGGTFYLAGMNSDSSWTWSDAAITFYDVSTTLFLNDLGQGKGYAQNGLLGMNFLYYQAATDSFFDIWFFGKLYITSSTDDAFAAYLNPTGLEITAVPVPAAVWLLGSGLLGLVGLRRKFSS